MIDSKISRSLYMPIKNNDLLLKNHSAITQIICSILLLIVICLFDELHHFGVWSDFLCGAIGVFIAWKGYRIVSNKNAPPPPRFTKKYTDHLVCNTFLSLTSTAIPSVAIYSSRQLYLADMSYKNLVHFSYSNK